MAKKSNVNANLPQLSIVQFLHHGEGTLKNMQCKMIFPWNQADRHYRKYMCCSGKYMQNGVEVQDRLMFWGEWEPDSYIIKDFGAKNSFPRYLQKPIWPCQVPNKFSRCGTDPFVFSKPFVYDFCDQDTFALLSNLDKGSLILFGFHKKNPFRFIVDTVFVVGDYLDFTSANLSLLQSRISEKDYLIIEQNMPFLNSGKKYRCYFGATPQNPVNGMYSFVPCCLYSEGKNKFLSITNNISNIINIQKTQGVTQTKCNSINNVKSIWNNIKTLTAQQGLLEGTRFYL